VSPENEGELLNAATLRWLNEFASQGIFTTDAQLRVESWNRWLEQHSGVAAESAIGRRLFDIFPEIALRGFEAHYRAALAGESRVLAHTFHKFLIPAAASTPEPAQTARIAPLLVGGRVAGTITWIEDVSERVATERELRHQIEAAEFSRTVAEDALRTKDEFLATLSHELRTPLNAIVGWGRMLLDGSIEEGKKRKALEVIDRNAALQVRLVDDILDVSRIITGGLRLEVRPVDLGVVIAAALDAIRPAAVAGSFYPADAATLRRAVEGYLAGAEAPEGPPPRAIIAPHAGYVYSGPIAARAYAALAPWRGVARRVIVAGPCHRVYVPGVAVPSASAFATPLGTLSLDEAALARLRALPWVETHDRAHAQEHCIEVQLPFLQSVLGEFELVPLVVGDASPDEMAATFEAIWEGASPV